MAGQAAFVLGFLCLPAKAEPAIDLDLVIAVDVSISMDTAEKTLQRDGFVAAFRDPEIALAVTAGPRRRIAVTVMEWGGPDYQVVIVPRTPVDGSASANALADRIAARLPGQSLRGTAIGDALLRASTLFARNQDPGVRRVVDLSGDGINNAGRALEKARAELTRRGITINGLPVVYESRLAGVVRDADAEVESPQFLVDYFNSEVIGGPDAFVVPVNSMAGFADAIRRKLLREIRGPNEIAMSTIQP